MSIRWRLVVGNGLILLLATAFLVLTPATVSYPASFEEAVVAALGLGAMIAVNGALVANMLAPLRRLRDAVDSMDSPAASAAVPVVRDDEVGLITRAFNDMVVRLGEERHRATSLVIASQERERERVSRELHDGVGQTMTVVLLQLKALERAVDGPLRDQVVQASEVARTALDEVRAVSRHLRPGPLGDLGLVPALKALVSELRQSSGIDISCTADPVDGLGHDAELVAYRVAQEALTNVVRHARATRAEVDLRWQESGLTLSVMDDGCGLSGPPGTGVAGMRERARLVHGTLELSSRKEQGTTVVLHIPRPAATEESPE